METLPRKERKENSCFDNNKRMILEGYLLGKTGFPKITNRTQLAEIFKCDRKTIYNEIKRGTVEHLQSDLSTIFEYNAEYAQNIANERNANRGMIPKIMLDTAIPGVSNTDLPNKGVKYKENGSRKNFSRAKCAEHSIDNRPKEVEDRENFGHWELDTVKGGKNTSTACLFTMTERKSRNEIARKMPDAKGKSTVEVLDKIERKLGSEAFRRIFITMTCDGGTEFMDIEGIERSCIDGKQRTKLYFAHPYTACERGTNENHNRILRRFFPKGCDFSKVTDEEVSKAEHWMNNYPRRIHGGKTPAMIYKKCCNF